MEENIKQGVLKIIKQTILKISLKLMSLVSPLIIRTFDNSMKVKAIISKNVADLIDIMKTMNGDFIEYSPFDYWVNRGFYILPNHFYQSIPDILNLNKRIFQDESPMYGIHMNDDIQLDLLKNKFSKYKKEFKSFALSGNVKDYEFYLNNLAFDGLDALVYYSMIRTFKPKSIIEVGSGWSTKLAAKAARRIQGNRLFSIEPYPQGFLQKGFPGFTKLIARKVQDVPFDFFARLKKNDILFIDSSHTVKIGGDVNYLIFNILPKLKKGVLVHIHDIFFPDDYPEVWIKEAHKFWNEQYLLQAFLMFNNEFEVIYGNTYMGRKYPKEVKKVFSSIWPYVLGGSFWIRRK